MKKETLESLKTWIAENIESFDNRDDASAIMLFSKKSFRELAETELAEEEIADLKRMWGKHFEEKPAMSYWWKGDPNRDDFIHENAVAILGTKHLGRIEYAPFGRKKPDFVVVE